MTLVKFKICKNQFLSLSNASSIVTQVSLILVNRDKIEPMLCSAIIFSEQKKEKVHLYKSVFWVYCIFWPGVT